jgi:hypothetical protein
MVFNDDVCSRNHLPRTRVRCSRQRALAVDIDATAALSQDQDALRWLRTRPGRRGLVV